jgi:hypothetical protein
MLKYYRGIDKATRTAMTREQAVAMLLKSFEETEKSVSRGGSVAYHLREGYLVVREVPEVMD